MVDKEPQKTEAVKEKDQTREYFKNTIEKSAAERDQTTINLLGDLVSIPPKEFIEMACKAIKTVKEPGAGEPLARAVFDIQHWLGFKLLDNSENCDAKFGPYTLEKLINKLKTTDKEKFEVFQKYFKKTSNLPPPANVPDTNKPNTQQNTSKDVSAKKEAPPAVNPNSKLSIGDSLSVGTFGSSETVKGSMGVLWMLNRVKTLQKRGDLKNYTAFTLWGGANNVGNMEANQIMTSIKQICEIILSENPKARIELITLPPMAGWKGFKNITAKVIRRVNEFNAMLKNYAKEKPQNFSVVDIYPGLVDPKKDGYSKLKGDGLHPWQAYKSIKKMVNDDLAQGTQDNLSSNA